MKQVEQQLAKMKEAIEKGKDMRYRAEAKLEELENQRKRLLEDLEELGVKPEDLEGEIARLEREIEKGLQETMDLIPKELLRDE
ncbi:hypothetical protein P4637_18530 [Halalkalibacterium halodurans]|jgi:chromosome segregation ATPase|uniref:BH2380 protein n=3 Tax=Halalkalibacterium halodurans TaxID=86665 RepID=Q9KAB0_HALH5|nr:hypothetical protein [Halalkalibacterium halodurans]MDY7222928.1 hypothetical protein [Halalkalibacterium halodurans]MDY7242149.1 hypothetical protein [Halalkalibacterium halodurans]MED3646243.1 hypothetical protein [Halalkalibacterium halodurans]MED4080045.1 hypothetical protein [Halalkalibacterium halodurans]MED4086812.1 hypothetical protein [Halalkalibacterium halodurans]